MRLLSYFVGLVQFLFLFSGVNSDPVSNAKSTESGINIDDEIKVLLDEGMKALTRRNYKIAESKYSQALSLDDSCRVRWRRAKVYEITDNIEKQIEDIDKCYEDPLLGEEAIIKNISNYLKICDITNSRKLLGKLKSNSEKANFLNRKVQTTENTIKNLETFLRNKSLTNGNLSHEDKIKGIRLLESANEACPNYVPIAVNLANLLYSSGEIRESRKWYNSASHKLQNSGSLVPERIHNLDSDDLQKRVSLGLIDVFAAFSDVDSLTKYIKSELNLDPDNSSMLKSWKYGLGAVAKCIQQIGKDSELNSTKKKQAIKCLEQAREIRGDLIKNNKGEIYKTFGVDGLIIKIYQILVEINSKRPDKNLNKIFERCVDLYQTSNLKTKLTSQQKDILNKFHESNYLFKDASCGCASEVIEYIANNWRGAEFADEDRKKAEEYADFITETDGTYINSNSGDNNRNKRTYKDNIKRIQHLASQRDFYLDLGVSKNATEKEIKKAYHKIAMECHPDRFPENEKDSPEAKKCEEKFRRAAEAKSVLSDPDKRAQFDRGEYYENEQDRQQQAYQGWSQGNPFAGHGGGFPFSGFNFGGGNQKFEFHFG